VFWVYCVFVGALIACCAWLLLAPAQDPARPATAWPVPPPGYPAAGDRIPAMAGAPATASTTTADEPTTAGTPITVSDPTTIEAPTMAAPVTSQAPATPPAPSASPRQEDAPGSAGDLSVKPGDSPADPSGTQQTMTSDGHPADPARPADPAS
jgi:hypothetical protein